ncbi:MAG TPA: diguanylate cyclase [Kineosporiaceae bacterium]|nr:diguanylate cyclase [Kineosporiaceae bacterium]
MTDLPHRHTERLADLGLARMLAALAAVHVLVGAAAATVLDHAAAVLVGSADTVAAAALLGTAALAVRIGPHARAGAVRGGPGIGVVAGAGAGVVGGGVVGGGADARRFDVAVAAAALGVAGVATALRMIATGASWTGLELPLAVVVALALPGRLALLAAVAVTAPAGGAVTGVVVRGTGAGSEILGSVLPLVAVPAAAVIALAWRRRAALLEARLRVADHTADQGAVRDHLTGAVNQRGLEMVADPMLQNARRQGEAVHCLLVDVDDFRLLNERVGRQAGDDVLRSVAAALQSAIRTTDVVGRWSDDEFVVVGPGTGTSPLELERRVHLHLASSPPLPPAVWTPQVSIGSATLVPWDEGDLSSLLGRAEKDLGLRRSLRRQRAERDSAGVAAPPHRVVEDGAEH